MRCTMLCHRALVILFAVNVPIVTGLEPDFRHPLKNVTIPQGRDASFTCTVENLGGYRVSPSSSASGDQSDGTNIRVAWIKADTKAILAIHEHVITNNGRLAVSHNYNTWTLLIREVQHEDRGLYMCQINTDPMKSQSAYLEVVIPPDIISDDISTDVMVPEGGSAKFECKARGYPKPKIAWKREDNNNITIHNNPFGVKTKSPIAEGEVLTLPKVTRSEMGAYFCVASNGVPPAVSKKMTLYVNFHPMIQVPNQLLSSPFGTNVTLSCNVEASPKAINYWTRESGEMIINNTKYLTSEKQLSLYSVQMQLDILNFQKQDPGGYKCISKNSIGDAESTIRLYDMAPTKNAKNGEKMYENMEDREQDHRLNNVYQGSLRETGSTVDPNFRGEDSRTSTSADRRFPSVFCITILPLLVSYHSFVFT